MNEHNAFSLDFFVQKEGVQFLHSAYAALFGRPLDVEGRRTYCASMRAGFSKIHILYSLVNSPEGKSLGLSLPGLTLRYWMERMLPPPFIRRVLGMPVPDPSWALLFADLDALHYRIETLENAYWHEAGEGTGTARKIDQILHNSGESARIAHELERGMAHLIRVETVTPRQALDLAHMLRASISKLEGHLELLTAKADPPGAHSDVMDPEGRSAER